MDRYFYHCSLKLVATSSHAAISRNWRIFTPKTAEFGEGGSAWDIGQLEFYTNPNCAGDKVATPTMSYSNPSSSGYASDSGDVNDQYHPSNAFDGDYNSLWGGRPGNGVYFVKIEYDSPIEVKCVRVIHPNKNVPPSFWIQYLESDTWKDAVDYTGPYIYSIELTIPSPTPSSKPSRYPSTSPTVLPSMVPTLQPTAFPSCVPSVNPTTIPTTTPSSIEPSDTPTSDPTNISSQGPSFEPSSAPSVIPSLPPSNTPSTNPSYQPSIKNSFAPTLTLTDTPTTHPSKYPSNIPSPAPTNAPSMVPSSKPSLAHTFLPSVAPSTEPSNIPTSAPTILPTVIQSSNPSILPTKGPSSLPSVKPSSQPSADPTHIPTSATTVLPSMMPSFQPTTIPSVVSTAIPTAVPSLRSSIHPSDVPTSSPTPSPSKMPSPGPSNVPTSAPTAIHSLKPSTHPSLEHTSIPTSDPTARTIMDFQNVAITIRFDGVPGRLLDDDEVEELQNSLLDYLNKYVPWWQMITNQIVITGQWMDEVVRNSTSTPERLLKESSNSYQLFVIALFDAYVGPDHDLSLVLKEALLDSGYDDDSTNFVEFLKGYPDLGLEENSFFYNVDMMEFSTDKPSLTPSAAATSISLETLAAISGAAVSIIFVFILRAFATKKLIKLPSSRSGCGSCSCKFLLKSVRIFSFLAYNTPYVINRHLVLRQQLLLAVGVVVAVGMGVKVAVRELDLSTKK